MSKEVSAYDWEEIRDALEDYATWLEGNEPYAVETIAAFRRAADACPTAEDFT